MPRISSALRSERISALLLLGAAVLGLALANSPVGPALIAAQDEHLVLPGIDISIGHIVSDGLLAVFFFLVAIELKRELVIGELNSAGKALLPAIAAVGGVAVPAGVYLLVVGLSGEPGLGGGWPIPTATDIAFALGVLALFGSAIPTRVRVFLLALAVLDDLVAILIIAVFFTADADLVMLGGAVLAVAAFGLVSRLLRPRSPWLLARRPVWPLIVLLVLIGAVAWYLTYRSGVHATIAGVALGLVMTRRPAGRVHHVLEPWSNGVVLPVFALSAALVAIPQLGIDELSPAFWAIVLALPVGKLLGIAIAGGVSGALAVRRDREALQFADVLVVGALGGIGFTVSLLMNELAFADSPEVADEGTLAVLLGSGISIVIAAILVSLRSRHYARLHGRRPVIGS
ncbi:MULTISPECIES: Na+/H+ antiporter NhaA [unclassified Rathayibacter]|uniref:Na+/H+ antiporter NhaA n=1 Tax=unclassified Rathayibacter TaxID=2609250 RepID=UPI0006F4FBE9|nr:MULTISPECIES: Na+/H+ antiporter NhaA [unclassified Rathayibacter]KQQ03989.1 sodium:proton antiporter [Rathayibacter sp. Leaf294]KQS12443.1 sodium:proton antiporter [Rathayibacter sp. Leaf185]